MSVVVVLRDGVVVRAVPCDHGVATPVRIGISTGLEILGDVNHDVLIYPRQRAEIMALIQSHNPTMGRPAINNVLTALEHATGAGNAR
jgi:hypothetical protein